ncbi:MAG TPA: hypothetical protein VIB79_18800 [Candidatus Binatia bacterium]|jgi:chromosome segregation ATPase
MTQHNRGEFHHSNDSLIPKPDAEFAAVQTALAAAEEEIRRYESQRVDWQCQVAEKQLLLQTRAAEIEQCRAEIAVLRNRIRELESTAVDLVMTPRDPNGRSASTAKTETSTFTEAVKARTPAEDRRWRGKIQKRRWISRGQR